MKKLIIIAAVLLVAAGPQTPAPAPAPAPPSSTVPPIVLSPAIPGDVNVTAQTVSVEAFQPDFDVYSWNTFIALNWPPGPNGNGDPKQTIGKSKSGDNDTVWEHYRDTRDIFLPGGKKPTWNGPGQPVPPECAKLAKPGMRVLSQVGKTPTVLTASSQPFNTGPLIDQNGVYTRFEILLNKTMFDYILNNSLYSKAGQKVFTPPVKFTCGTLGSAGKPGVEGAIMVKSAWKVINLSEKPRFHSEDVLVYSPASDNPKYPASCTARTMGLVGLHIAHKTQHASQWLWSTFEHVDNAPTDQDVKSGNLKAKYNYYNPKCDATKCPPNAIPPRPWDPTKVSSFHSQVVRMDQFNLPIYASSAAARNADAKKLLKGVNPKSVWQNYMLISTMWPTNPGNCGPAPGDPLGTPAPTFLANTTLETYLQRVPPQPNVSSQCIECHNNATMTVPVASDFTYVLERAN